MKPCISSRSMVYLALAILAFSASTALLPPVRSFEDCSDSLIVDSLIRAKGSPKPSVFMEREEASENGALRPYYSQYGLTYRLLLPWRDHFSYGLLHHGLSFIYAALTAITFWLFALCFGRKVSENAGWAFLTLCCTTPAFLMFSGSFYWQLPLLVLPWMISFAFVTHRPAVAVAGPGLVLLIRFLGGYEYLTPLILSPIAATMLHFAMGNLNVAQTLWRGIAQGVAGTCAFGLALAIHIASIAKVEGSLQAALEKLGRIVTYRTSGDYFGGPPTLKYDAIALINSFFRNESILLIGLGLVGVLMARTSSGKPAALRIAGALVFAFACGLSWQFLARGHMRYHAHINFIIYLIPYGLTVYTVISHEIGKMELLRRN